MKRPLIISHTGLVHQRSNGRKGEIFITHYIIILLSVSLTDFFRFFLLKLSRLVKEVIYKEKEEVTDHLRDHLQAKLAHSVP